MTVRRATAADAECVLRILDAGRAIMRQHGNMAQWGNGYPAMADVQRDITQQQCYLITLGNEPQGTFCLQTGTEPTYAHIEGAWLNPLPYGTIHRLATLGLTPGVGQCCLSWCKHQLGNLRADTHQDNRLLGTLLESHGFQYCGIVHMLDGSPRLAYQWVRGL